MPLFDLTTSPEGIRYIADADLPVGVTASSSFILACINGNGKALRDVVDGTLAIQLPVAFTATVSVAATGIQWIGHIPDGMTIQSWEMVADASGSVVLDLWVASAAIPEGTDKITGSAQPTLSSVQFASSSTLTGWTTGLTAGDILAINVDSASTATSVTLTLRGVRV